MKKKIYLPPTTTVMQVELEGQICNGSIEFKDTDKVTIADQEIDTANQMDFSSSDWDESATN